MARFLKKRTQAKGESPGTLIFIGKQKMEKNLIRIIHYNLDKLIEKKIEKLDELEINESSKGVFWINIDGIHNIELIKKVGEKFDIHPLHLEDIVNTDQRPRIEEKDKYLYIVLKMLKYNEKEKNMLAEQFSVILGKNHIITFQEQIGDVFEPVRERIRKAKGRIRGKGCDYLAYALLDIIVDNYIILIESIGEQIEELESKILHNPNKEVIKEIYHHKMELNFLRKSIRPVRDLVLQLIKTESSLITIGVKDFIKDLNEHIFHATEAIETYHTIISDQLSIYNTSVSNHMNEIMKVLTIFAAVFIPLTFLAGIYGMNFEYIPELKFKYSYPIFWMVILVIFLVMFLYFKKRKWIK